MTTRLPSPGPCPQCGEPLTSYLWDATRGPETWCVACSNRRLRAREAAARELQAALPALDTPTGHRVLATYVRGVEAPSLEALQAAPDHELLALRMFGPKLLALLRTVVPAPEVPAPVPARVAVIREIPDPLNPWTEHAAMVACMTEVA